MSETDAVTLHSATDSTLPGGGHFQRFMASTGVGMAIIALEGRIAQANPALAAMLGAAPADIAGLDLLELIHPDDRAHARTRLSELLEGRQASAAADGRVLARDGRVLETRFDATLVRDAAGQPLYVLGQVVEVGGERRGGGSGAARADHGDRVAMRAADFERASDDLKRFTYGVSHDLRAPLRSIASFGKLLDERAGGRLDAQDRDYLRRIREAARKMEGLLVGLQDLSRAMHAEFRSEPVDVSLLADWAGAELQDAEQGRAARIEVQPGLVARGDERALRQLFAALLHNAWKFSRARESTRIEVSGAREGDVLRVEVRDHGIGYDPRYADKLFQPFQRLHGEAEGAGSGLGLAIAKRIVDRHGGRISARSEPGAGCAFTIELPAGEQP